MHSNHQNKMEQLIIQWTTTGKRKKKRIQQRSVSSIRHANHYALIYSLWVILLPHLGCKYIKLSNQYRSIDHIAVSPFCCYGGNGFGPKLNANCHLSDRLTEYVLTGLVSDNWTFSTDLHDIYRETSGWENKKQPTKKSGMSNPHNDSIWW